jgi:hypothetical protein
MPKVMPTLKRLHGLEAGEVSLVPQGANKKRFLIFKNAEGKMQPHKQLLDLISKADPEVMQRVDERLKQHAAQFGAEPAMDQPAQKPVQKEDMNDVAEENEVRAVAAPLDEQSHAALKAVVRILSPFREKLPAGLVHDVLDAAGFEEAEEPSEATGLYNNAPGANRVGEGYQQPQLGDVMEAKAGGFKAIPAKIEGEEDDVLGEVKKSHLHEAVEKAQCVYKEHLEKLGYRAYPDAEMAMKTKDGEPVMKTKGEPVSKSAGSALDLSKVQPETRQQLELVLKSHKELVQKNADLEKRLQDHEEANRKKEIVQKAATFGNLPLPQDDIVAQLEDARKVSPEAYERVCKSFSLLNEQSKTSALFNEIGSSHPAAGSSSHDAEAKVKAIADGIVQKNANGMTHDQAMEIAWRTPEGQRLYAQYKAGRGGI